MSYFNRSELPKKSPFTGMTFSAVWINKAMVTMVDLAPHAVIPTHQHQHEQITYVISGKMKMTVGEETRIIGPGEGFTISPNVPHGCVVLDEAVNVIDSWSPAREDYKLQPNEK